jgi:hypothetical protein
MAVQGRSNIDTRPFITYTLNAVRKDQEILLTDAGRTTPLASRTLMAKVAASGKWVPFTDETATDGTGIPQGIYDPEGVRGDIAAADIAAGDVADVPIVIYGAIFDKDRLVIENSKTLGTVIGATTVQARTVSDVLRERALIAEDQISVSLYENA